MSILIHTVQFNKPVSFTDQTGVKFVNATTLETASLVTSLTVSPDDLIDYSVTWGVDPIAGDVIEWRYDGLGNYKDSSININLITDDLAIINDASWSDNGDGTWTNDGTNVGIADLYVDINAKLTAGSVYTSTLNIISTTGNYRHIVGGAASGPLVGIGINSQDITATLVNERTGIRAEAGIVVTVQFDLTEYPTIFATGGEDLDAQTLVLDNCLGNAQGFLPFGSNDASVLFIDDLRQINTDPNVTEIGAPVYGVDGADLSNGGDALAGISYDFAGMGFDTSDWINGITYTYWVENGFLVQTDGIIQIAHLVGINITAEKLLDRARDDSYMEILQSSGGIFGSRYNCSPVGKEDFVRYDFVVTASTIYIYVDYILVSTTANILATGDMWNETGLGFKHTNLGAAGTLYKIKDYMVSKRIIQQSPTAGFESVLVFGDSMPERGDWPDGTIGTGNDQSYCAVQRAGKQAIRFKDAAFYMEITRSLAKSGRFVGERAETGQNGAITTNTLGSYAVGGSGIEGGSTFLSAAVDTALITNSETPSLCVIWIGSNDVTNGPLGSPDIVLDASWKATYRVEIDRLILAGATKVVLCNVVDINSTTYYDSFKTLYQGRVHDINALILELQTDVPEVVVADLWTPFGGDTPNNSYYAPDPADRHTNDLGSVIAGQEAYLMI